MFNLNSEP